MLTQIRVGTFWKNLTITNFFKNFYSFKSVVICIRDLVTGVTKTNEKNLLQIIKLSIFLSISELL